MKQPDKICRLLMQKTAIAGRSFMKIRNADLVTIQRSRVIEYFCVHVKRTPAKR